MKARLLVNENLSALSIRLLRDLGYNVARVAEAGESYCGLLLFLESPSHLATGLRHR
jgi:hypothetical protein